MEQVNRAELVRAVELASAQGLAVDQILVQAEQELLRAPRADESRVQALRAISRDLWRGVELLQRAIQGVNQAARATR